jgi:hypothetical protein
VIPLRASLLAHDSPVSFQINLSYKCGAIIKN